MSAPIHGPAEGTAATVIPQLTRDDSIFSDSLLFRRCLAEREEFLRHKWIESEKKGFDIGIEQAWASLVLRHRGGWRRAWLLRRV